MGRDAERLDGVKVIHRLHLKSHQFGTHFPHFFAVVPLLLDHEPGHEQHERRAPQRDHRHDPVVMQDHEKCGDEVVDRDDDRREPADGIAADRADIPVEAVQDIAVGILVERQPVRIHDLVENVRLDIIIDIDAELRRDPADDAAEHQAEHRAPQHDGYHYPQFAGIVPGDDIDDILAGHTADQPHRCTEYTKDQVKCDGALVPGAVAEDPFPVVYDL